MFGMCLKMNTMGDYHDLYLKVDVLLLAGVFEKLISTCLDYYGLDPCCYFSCPGLSWDAMLQMTEIKLTNLRNWYAFVYSKRSEKRYF